MRYTVKQLSQLSGVTIRTLHHYDEIGLLKPAYIGENHYRYYEEKQLLLLQDIMFYRELGYALNDIRQILSADAFDKIRSLQHQKSLLQSTVERTHKLMQTIDKTISHLRGTIPMKLTELFEGFDPVKQQEYEQYMLDKGLATQQDIDDSWQSVAHWKKADWEQFKLKTDALYKDIAKALSEGHTAGSDVMQRLMARHYLWIKPFWKPTAERYIGLAHMYLEHPDYKSFHSRYHPDLPAFLVEAMTIFAHNTLSKGEVL